LSGISLLACVLAFSARNPRINHAMNQITEEKKEKKRLPPKLENQLNSKDFYQKALV
jgi:hypothetical protein